MGLVGQASPVKGGEEKGARSISGKRPTGTIGAVRTWCKAKDQEPRLGVTETGNWTGPIVRASGNRLSSSHQSRTAPALNQLLS